MTGKELYQIYAKMHAENGCICDEWDELDDIEKVVWCRLAIELLIPE